MAIIELEIAMDNNLVAKTRELAIQYFGDDSETSLAQVLELAFRMRLLWSRSVRTGQHETGEALSAWEFPESTVNLDNNGGIKNWLFRR